MAMTSDGKRKSSKFRAARYDREHSIEDGGPRAMANQMQAKKEGNPDEHPMGEEAAEEQVHPGIHEEIKGVMAQHGPAHTTHMVHDDDRQTSHVHTVHADGHEHHADHQGEGHRNHAHEHAMHASGIDPRESPEVDPNPQEAPDDEEPF